MDVAEHESERNYKRKFRCDTGQDYEGINYQQEKWLWLLVGVLYATSFLVILILL
jgi:hypothetical protein